MKEKQLRQEILSQLCNSKEALANIVFNILQREMRYDKKARKFVVYLNELRINYFKDKPNECEGIIEGTNIHWQIKKGCFTVWLKK